jgi:hypothetical protein
VAIPAKLNAHSERNGFWREALKLAVLFRETEQDSGTIPNTIERSDAGNSIVRESVRPRQGKPAWSEAEERLPLAGKGAAALVPASALNGPQRAFQRSEAETEWHTDDYF